jgi:hypothetical protein
MTTETETPMVAEIDCSTNTISYRPMTDEEVAAQEARAIEYAELQTEREAQAQAKAEAKASALAKLEALGLTEEEAEAIAG